MVLDGFARSPTNLSTPPLLVGRATILEPPDNVTVDTEGCLKRGGQYRMQLADSSMMVFTGT